VEDGDLDLLLAKNDAFNYNGDIFKTGRAKISLSPNPFAKGKPFKQVLDLTTGSIRIEADGIAIRVWTDANRPVYHVEIESPQEVAVTMTTDPWERIDGCPHNCTSEPVDTPTQDVMLHQDGHILSYFAVGDRSVYPTELEFYEVEHMAGEYPDPYRFNTFGICPTLLEMANLPGKADLDGLSLVPLLKEPQRPWERPALMTEGPGNHAVRSDRWRYIRYSDGAEELYDHENDPWELSNLATNPEFAETLAALRKWLPKSEAPGKGMDHLYRPVPPAGAGLPGSGYSRPRNAAGGKYEGKTRKESHRPKKD
jgi:hypothetical protein